MRYIIIMIIYIINIAISQQIYEIPFDSRDNVIELQVKNTSVITAKGVMVKVVDKPEGIKFREEELRIEEIESNEEEVVEFSFTVEKKVAIKKEQVIGFSIVDKDGQSWRKEIRVKVGGPKTFELYQNYPNPFNPTTTITYQLPDVNTRFIVSLRIYDLLGREVITTKQEQTAGYYEQRIDASNLSSGVYIYRIHAQSTNGGKSYTSTKKMVLMK